jgi:formylglycine-generating enzyme required for sulfatase activity
LRRSRILRWAAALAVPLIALASWGAVAWKNRAERRVQVDATLAEAYKRLRRVEDLSRHAARLRRHALEAFDGRQVARGEARWKRYRVAVARLQRRYLQVSQTLETALLRDRQRDDARRMFADVLYDRLLLAERLHQDDAAEQLRKRLELYDVSGERRRRLQASGVVTLEPVLVPSRLRPGGPRAPGGPGGPHGLGGPRGAGAGQASPRISLYRYRLGKDGVYRKQKLEREADQSHRGSAPTALRRRRLPPGSYLAVITAPGYVTARLPFLVRRGQRLDLRVPLPRREAVPEGFVYVPAGRFLFGSTAPEQLRRDFFHAVPRHAVDTAAYLIARHETTFGQWIEFLEALDEDPARREAHRPRVGKGGFKGALHLHRHPDGSWELSMRPTTRRYRARDGELLVYRDRERLYPNRERAARHHWRRLPVVGISVADARAYARWLDDSGRVPGARLCTELEWERGARGADGRVFPHGRVLSPRHANIDATYGKRPETMGPDEVGRHPRSASPFGLHDMAGNVWEWTRSSLKPGEFAARGGSWYFGANSARSTGREITESSFRDLSVGVRICADAPQRKGTEFRF